MTTLKKTKLLLVDDDPAIRRLLCKWISPLPYQVSEASDGRQAMEQIRQDCPDIIVTDWDMPDVDGLALCQWLRDEQLGKYTYVLFLSARCGADDMIRGLEAGADDFLKKPIDKGEFLARLRAGTRVLDLESRLNLLAKTDSLTGLENQHTFFESLKIEYELAMRHKGALSCVMIDIDHFKRINDAHGHGVGDDVIRRVGRTILRHCRASDVVARYGGEEYCVLLSDTDEDGAVLWADRMRQTIGALEFNIDNESLRVSASFGVAQFTTEMRNDAEGLVRAAKEALLVAKRTGRDRVVDYNSLSEDGGLEQLVDEATELLGGVTAAEAMTTVVAGLNKNLKVGAAADYFLRFRIPSAPVVDDAGQLVGILSERDLMGVMLWPDWSNTRIGQVMKENVITYQESTPVMQIHEFLCRVSIRAVVIVAQGRPTGILGRGSLMRWFSNSLIAQRSQASDEQTAEMFLADPRDRTSSIALALRGEADRLINATTCDRSDLTPAVVGSASRMQELVNDLLATSRNLPWQLAAT